MLFVGGEENSVHWGMAIHKTSAMTKFLALRVLLRSSNPSRKQLQRLVSHRCSDSETESATTLARRQTLRPFQLGTVSSTQRTRADYTRNDLLKLNDDPLPTRRHQAYGNFRARVREYARRKHVDRVDATELSGLRAELLRLPHQLVWREMQRQRASIPELELLFAEVPEAIGW